MCVNMRQVRRVAGSRGQAVRTDAVAAAQASAHVQREGETVATTFHDVQQVEAEREAQATNIV